MQLELGMFRTTKGFRTNHKSTELVCENCNAAFLANRKNARFCSSSCRSQFWLNKNEKKVITLAVPADIDDDYLEEVKAMLLNYKKGDTLQTIGRPSAKTEPVQKEVVSLMRKETMVFDQIGELRTYLREQGFEDYKVPKIDNGIYYDEGLSIKKVEEGWETLISKRVS
ncbi:MAG: hypothetical protein KC517_01535 [Bacteroidetes bacterium]|jgi:hypothetical protein|nr:hypothetical protein [Bacteroidota bacterium]